MTFQSLSATKIYSQVLTGFAASSVLALGGRRGSVRRLDFETRRARPWFVALMVLASLMSPAAIGAQTVAMVTDLVGRAATVGEASRTPVGILAELEEGARIELGTGSKLVVMYLSSGDQYAINGPAAVLVNAGSLLSLSGERPTRRGSAVNQDGPKMKLRPGAFAQGALVLRSARPSARIALLNLSGTVTLDSAPTFRWQGIAGARQYHLQLQDDAGQMLFEAEVEGETLTLADAARLRDGLSYTWTVSTRLTDGRRYSSSGDFRMATSDVRELVERSRPSAGADVAERIAFATWLENLDLRDEARRYWQGVVNDRPDSVRLRELAGQ